MFHAGHFPGRFVYKELDSVLIGEPVAAANRIVAVIFEAVIALDDGGGTSSVGVKGMSSKEIDIVD